MSKERLEEIIKHSPINLHPYYFKISFRNMEWLISQAERVQDWKDTANGFYARVEQLKEQNNRYREAIDKITDVLATSRGNNEYATYKIRCILGRLYDSLEGESE